MIYVLFTIAFPIYCAAYIVAKALHVPGRDDMPTPAELIAELKNQ